MFLKGSVCDRVEVLKIGFVLVVLPLPEELLRTCYECILSMPTVNRGVRGCCRNKCEPSFSVVPELGVNVAALIDVHMNQAGDVVPNYYLYRLQLKIYQTEEMLQYSVSVHSKYVFFYSFHTNTRCVLGVRVRCVFSQMLGIQKKISILIAKYASGLFNRDASEQSKLSILNIFLVLLWAYLRVIFAPNRLLLKSSVIGCCLLVRARLNSKQPKFMVNLFIKAK